MFRESLAADLTLRLGSEVVKVKGGDVKAFEVTARPWGFEARVTFWTLLEPNGDPVFASLTTKDLVKARLEVKGVYRLPTTPPDAFAVEGIVTEKRIYEDVNQDATGVPIRGRRYDLTIRDAAAVLWGQHRPCSLKLDGTVSDLLETNKLDGITLTTSWDKLGEAHQHLCLGLGADRSGATFYDFLVWFCDTRHGVLTYDGFENKYAITGAKAATGTPATLPSADVAKVDVRYPETVRHDVRVLNASTLSPTNTVVTRDLVLTGLHRDVLVRTPVAATADGVKGTEELRLNGSENDVEVEVAFRSFPTTTFRPGVLVKLEKGLWSKKTLSAGKVFRVVDVHLVAKAEVQDPRHDRGQPHTWYSCEMSARLEVKADPRPRLPAYRRPTWPILVEGKIVSTPVGGDEEARSYQVAEDAKTGVWVYVVDVVLWNQKINVPFQPEFFAPHFYFPAYKNSRVLLELSFDEVRIARYLDWGPTVRLAADGQGNHLLLGFNAKSETSIRNFYEDQKPVLSIKRFDKGDQQLFKFAEGLTTIEVKEEAATAAATETYDVTLQVEMAKGELKGKVGGGIGEVTTKFGGSQAAVVTAIGGATGEVQSELETTTSEIGGQIDSTRGELEAVRSDLTNATAPVLASAEEAKAAIEGMIS